MKNGTKRKTGKNTIFGFVLIAVIAALSLAAFGGEEEDKEEKKSSLLINPAGGGTDYDAYVPEDDGYYEDEGDYYEDDNDGFYYAEDNRKRVSILTDPGDYEAGNGSDENAADMYAAVNDYVMTAYGLTYREVDGMTNYDNDVMYLFDNSPNRYGMEYQNNTNCIYIFHKEGNDPGGDGDRCVGACGWFSRLMDFDHEWAAYVYDLEAALRDSYPDCTGVGFTDRTAIPDAPGNIGDTLAYMDFTVPFYNGGSTTVRLYVEADSYDSIVYSDAWAMLCLPNEY